MKFIKKAFFFLVLITNSATLWALPIIRMNVDALPYTLEPSKVADTIAAWVMDQVGQRLVNTEASGVVSGSLAKKWEISADGRLYIFDLDPGAKFSDGSSVTSQDIIRTLENVKKNFTRGYVSHFTSQIQNLKALSPTRLRIQLKKRQPAFLAVLSAPMFTVSKTCGAIPCFSGAFDIVAHEKDSLDLRRRHDGQTFRLQQLSFEDAEDKFKKNELDILRSYSLMHLSRVRAASTEKIVVNDERSYFIALNSRSPLFNTSAKRADFVAKINFTELKKNLKDLNLEYSPSLVAPSFSLGKSFDESVHSHPPTSTFKSPRLPVFVSPLEQELGPLTSAIFKNIPVKLENLPKNEAIKRYLDKTYDGVVMGFGASVKDFEIFSIFFHSTSLFNLAQVNSKTVDKLFQKSWNEENPRERFKYVEDVLTLNQKQHWYLPLAHSPLIFALAPTLNIEGKTMGQDLFVPSSNLDLEKISRRSSQ